MSTTYRAVFERTHVSVCCGHLMHLIVLCCFFQFRTGLNSLKWFPTWRNVCATLRYIACLIFSSVIPFKAAAHDTYVVINQFSQL